MDIIERKCTDQRREGGYRIDKRRGLYYSVEYLRRARTIGTGPESLNGMYLGETKFCIIFLGLERRKLTDANFWKGMRCWIEKLALRHCKGCKLTVKQCNRWAENNIAKLRCHV